MPAVTAPYRIESQPDHLVVVLLPELNQLPWDGIERAGSEILAHLNSRPAPALLVDLNLLDHMGSAQVALVTRIWKLVKERDGRMVIVNRNPIVQEVLTIAGLTKIWTIVPTRDEAQRALDLKPAGTVTPAPGERWLSLTAVLVAVMAAIAMALVLTRTSTPLGEQTLLWIQLGAAGLGVILGLVALIVGTARDRFVAAAAVLACVVFLVVGALSMRHDLPPGPKLPAEQPAK